MKTNRLIFTFLCIAFFAVFGFSLLHNNLGSDPLSKAIMWDLRLPRTLTALTCGGLLALAGLMMQLLLQNPLADPYTLGVSSGAALVTLVMVLLGFHEKAFALGSWLGSALTIVLIVILAKKHHFQAYALLLVGVALASVYGAVITLLLLLSQDTTLHSLLFWLTGDLSNAQYPWGGAAILLLGTALGMHFTPGLNLLLRGERDAQALGLSLNYYKVGLFFLSALFTAISVNLAGCLGFIGLIIPHLTRQLVGHDHRFVIPCAVVLGGSLLLLADTCAQTLFAPVQLPVGILLTFIGVPLFISLLSSCQR
jgi:iron complex transport system permease protein